MLTYTTPPVPRPTSWILPPTPSDLVNPNVDENGAPILGWLPLSAVPIYPIYKDRGVGSGTSGKDRLIPIYSYTDLYLLRPELRAGGTVAALGYRVNKFYLTIPFDSYRFWRCLGRLKVPRWNVITLSAVQHQLAIHSDEITTLKWTRCVLWAYDKWSTGETVSRLNHIRREHREIQEELKRNQQLEKEYNSYEYKQTFTPSYQWCHLTHPSEQTAQYIIPTRNPIVEPGWYIQPK